MGIALFAVAWVWWAAPLERRAAPLERIADNILFNETYDPESLAPVLAYLDGIDFQGNCYDGRIGHAAIIRLYAAAAAHTAGRQDAPELLDKARHNIRSSLACSPQQPFLWYGLFWVELTRGAPAEEYIPLLEFSYELGPREAWIAYYRSVDALEHIDKMRPEIQQLVRAEFLNLVRDNPPAAVNTVREANEQTRSTILGLLATLPEEKKQAFARQLEAGDVKVDVPGVNYDELFKRGTIPRLPGSNLGK